MSVRGRLKFIVGVVLFVKRIVKDWFRIGKRSLCEILENKGFGNEGKDGR